MNFPAWFAMNFPGRAVESDTWYFTLEAWYAAMENEGKVLADALGYMLSFECMDIDRTDRKALIKIFDWYRNTHKDYVPSEELAPFAYKHSQFTP